MTQASEVETVDEDASLVLRAKDGDKAAENELLVRHEEMIVGMAKASARKQRTRDVDDEVSEGYISLRSAIHSFDPTMGVPFGAWARIQIGLRAKTRLRNENRKWPRGKLIGDCDVTFEDGVSPVDTAIASDDGREGMEFRETWEHQASRLSPEEWRIYVLRSGFHPQGVIPWDQIGEICGISSDAAKQRHHRAIQKIDDREDAYENLYP